MENSQTNDLDINRHIESLRTRLRFAKFKLSNGWEDKALCDVENYWKQKQKASIKDIPTPRFTQQHIIDKHATHPKRLRRPSKTLPSPIGSPDNKKTRREPVKNSLEFLSYAIAMTEKKSSPDWTHGEPSLSIPDLLVEDETPSPTSSAAAHTMMMFFNNNRS